MPENIKSAWARAEDAGIDLSLIESNQRLSVAERLYRHDVALNSVLKLREGVEKRYEKTR